MMAAHNSRIIVASFAPLTETCALQHTLQRLKYEPDILPGTTWLEIAAEHRNQTTILFFGSTGNPPKKILVALNDLEQRPSLALFAADRCYCDPILLRRCHEVGFWPCGDRELAIRLDRASGTMLFPAPHVAETTNDKELARFRLIGNSPAFLSVLELIDKVAECDATVLIEGETGTGKEMAARAIHYRGSRRSYPFVPVNCGAMPDDLVDNEFFGHEKGAFTDAKKAQTGLVAQAHGGTLFLDEVEALSPKAQVTLLRFLQDREYRPLGSKHLCRADLRLIAASNADLRALVRRGKFRQDLFFRLDVFAIELPPLRERPGDMELLAHEFVRQFSKRYAKPIKVLHPRTLDWMKTYDRPGNIRELENFIHRGFLVSESGVIVHPERLDASGARMTNSQSGATVTYDKNFNHAKAAAIADFERHYLEWLMAETRGNITRAAQRADKERRALGKLLKKYGIDKRRYC